MFTTQLGPGGGMSSFSFEPGSGEFGVLLLVETLDPCSPSPSYPGTFRFAPGRIRFVPLIPVALLCPPSLEMGHCLTCGEALVIIWVPCLMDVYILICLFAASSLENGSSTWLRCL